VVCSRSGGTYDCAADVFYLADRTSSSGQETDNWLNTASCYAAATLVPGASLDPNPCNTRTNYTEQNSETVEFRLGIASN